MKRINPLIAVALASATLSLSAVTTQEIQQSIRAIKSVGPEGKGNARASKAWQKLSQADDNALIPLFNAMNDATPLAANWLRGAIHAIADRGIQSGHGLPNAAIERWLRDTSNNPRARRLAYDLIKRVDSKKADFLIRKFKNDPSVELRRDAVQLVLNDAAASKQNGNNSNAKKLYSDAFQNARDVKQIQAAVSALRGYGQTVDVPKQFGFLMSWQIIGPFDNSEREGFTKVYPPENKIDLSATYQGKEAKVKWQPFVSEDEYGKIDMNLPYGMIKEVVSYAYTEYDATESRKAELRLGGKNAWKVWVNGKFIFGRDEYHRGKRIDQYSLPIDLKKGTNTILVKVCQNEQEQSWTKDWDFQVRISDATGAAILAKNRKPTPKAALSPAKKK